MKGRVVSKAQTSTVEQGTQVTPAAIIDLATSVLGSKTLLSAIELGVFSELASAGALDGETLRERVGLHSRGATDFFDALVALGMLEREGVRYVNTPATEMFLNRAKHPYMGDTLELIGHFNFWESLTESLRTGFPQNGTKVTTDLYETFYADPLKVTQLAQGMTGAAASRAPAIVAKFPWQDYSNMMDIGCAEGAVPVQIALAHEHITCGGFDLPPLKPVFDAYVARFGLGERLSFTAGNFFVDPLLKADVLIIGDILYGLNIDEKRLLLKKAYDALPEGGALIVYDAILDDERRSNAYGLLLSLTMLVTTPGGFGYTGAECRAWMQETGFRESYVEHLAGPESMVVGIK